MSKKPRVSVKSALDNIKAKLESMDKKLDLIMGSKKLASTPNAYNNLPWKDFKDSKGAWIYADQKGAEQLVNRLKNAKENVVFSGGYRFSLSSDGRFVRRHPVRSKRKGVDR